MAIVSRDGRIQTTLSEINMVPFIDIVLVLLIIFMITAPVIQSGIEVNVPRTKDVKEITEDRLVVSVDAKQTVYLQNDAINIHDLGPKIREKLGMASRQSIYLRADGKVPWEILASVMENLKASGIENISVVTQPLEESRK